MSDLTQINCHQSIASAYMMLFALREGQRNPYDVLVGMLESA